MKVEDFKRLLELKEEVKKFSPEVISYIACREKFKEEYNKISEYNKLNKKLEDFLYDNQNSMERIITKLKIKLGCYEECGHGIYKANEALNEMKVIREIMNLIDTYDWKLMYSEYKVIEDGQEVTQIAVWEQNGDGLIRSHKVWNVVK